MKKTAKGSALIILTVILMLNILGGCGESEIKYYSYSPGSTFITNLKDSKKLVSCDIMIETTNKSDVEKLFPEKNYIIRDTILAVLRDQSAEAMEQNDIQRTLSELIVNRLNEKLEIDTVSKIYFDSLVAN